jgi:hypothetical protein
VSSDRAWVAIDASLGVLDGLTSRLDSVERVTAINRISVQGECKLGSLSWNELTAFLNMGGRLSIHVISGSWQAWFNGAPHGGIAVVAQGEPYEAFGATVEGAASDAIASGDAPRLYALCAEFEGSVTLQVHTEAGNTGFHWFWSTSDLTTQLLRSDALSWVTTYFGMPEARRILIRDAASAFLIGPSLVVHGPETWPDSPQQPLLSPRVQQYRDAFLVGEARSIPPPTAVLVESAGNLEDIRRALLGWAHILCWRWMCTDLVYVGAPPVAHFRFDGARVNFIQLQHDSLDSANESVDLWTWATETADPERRAALLRAVTLAASVPADLIQCAPIQNSATWLLGLSRQAALAEGFATRRAAREAALTAARAATEAATTATGRALDRMLIQVAAALGIVVAQYKDTLDHRTAARLLAVLVLLVVATGVLTVGVDLRAARRSLECFVRDLRVFRETLSTADIKEFATMDSVLEARYQIRRSQSVAVAVVAIVALALIALSLHLATPSEIVTI